MLCHQACLQVQICKSLCTAQAPARAPISLCARIIDYVCAHNKGTDPNILYKVFFDPKYRYRDRIALLAIQVPYTDLSATAQSSRQSQIETSTAHGDTPTAPRPGGGAIWSALLQAICTPHHRIIYQAFGAAEMIAHHGVLIYARCATGNICPG